MLKEFADWFSTKSRIQQTAILSQLEEVFCIQNSFGYIENLKSKIIHLQNRIKDYESDVKYKEALRRIKELETYIAKLENRPPSIDALYHQIPLEERRMMKCRIAGAFLYKKLKEENGNLRKKLKYLESERYKLMCRIIKLKIQNSEDFSE